MTNTQNSVREKIGRIIQQGLEDIGVQTAWKVEIDDLYIRASQEIAAENVSVVYTTQGERLSAVRNVFDNTTPTLYGLWDIRYLYRTD